MMLAGQAVAALDLRQHAADHGAQRVLHDFIVGNQAVADFVTHGRGGWTARARRASGESRLATRKIGSMACAMRTATVQRTTKETDIAITVNLDGTGDYSVSTGIGFLDHMVEQLSRHSLIDIAMSVKGDLHIDQHHTVEDSALALGEAIARALGDKRGIARYGEAHAPMDETLTRCTLDISGRDRKSTRLNSSH